MPLNSMPSLNRRQLLFGLSSAGGVLATGVPTSAFAQDDDHGFRIGDRPGSNWRLLGEVTAGRRVDRDEIRVNRRGAYSAIRLRVFDAPVEFFKVQVQFGNGDRREMEVRQSIQRGGATRVIALPGERRLIERVVFWYKTPRHSDRQARVQVWARA